MNKNEVFNGLYQSALITASAVGVSMVFKKLTGQSLAAPASLKESAKLAVAVAVGTFALKAAQQKGYIPKDLDMKT